MSASQVLIIDDDPQCRALLRVMLTTAGYDVHEAADGADGVACYDTQHFDMVITDILMPKQEGLETIRALRTLNPQAKIIAMSVTGEGRYGHLNLARKFGAARTLHKPFSRDELLAAVTAVLAIDQA